MKEILYRSLFSYILMDKLLNYVIVEVILRLIDVCYDNICINYFEILIYENCNYIKEFKERLVCIIL